MLNFNTQLMNYSNTSTAQTTALATTTPLGTSSSTAISINSNDSSKDPEAMPLNPVTEAVLHAVAINQALNNSFEGLNQVIRCLNGPQTLDKKKLYKYRCINLTSQLSNLALWVGGSVYGSYQFREGNNLVGSAAIVVAVVGAFGFFKIRSLGRNIENKSILPRTYKKNCCEKLLFGS